MADGLILFNSAERQMSWLAKRQNLLNRNLSNVDTPGYRGSDLRPLGFKETLRGNVFAHAADLQKTDGRHFAAGRFFGTGRSFRTSEYFEATLSENSVNLEENLVELNRTEADYALMTSLYRKYHSFLQTATRR